jgi:Flp pilus assembly protein TadD
VPGYIPSQVIRDEKRYHVIATVLLVFAGVVAYSNSFSGPFVFDDVEAIVENPTIRELGDIGAVFSPPFDAGQTVGGRPVLNLTFALNYAFGDLNTTGYHVVNLAIHLLAGLALFGLVRRALGLAGSPTSAVEMFGVFRYIQGTEASLIAAVIAGLWLLHPLQTESVTYIVQRAESLMGLLYLFTLYSFVRGTERGRSSGPWLAASLVTCLIGMGSKEVMVSAPLMVLLIDAVLVTGGGLGGIGAALKSRPKYYGAMFATWLLLGALILSTRNRGGSMGYGIEVTLGQYLLTQGPAIAHYLRLVFWPAPLIFDYGAAWISNPMAAAPAALLVIGLGVATLTAWFRAPILALPGTWFFAILAPTSLVPANRQTITEHRMYLALAPVLIVVVLGAWRLIRTRADRGRLLAAAGGVLAVVCVVLTLRRNEVYQSDLVLWTDTVAKRPGNSHGHNNLGRALVARGDAAGALSRFEEAVRLDPTMPDAQTNLGTALMNVGDLARARQHYEEAVRLLPDWPVALANLGRLHLRMGEIAEGIARYEQAVAIDPGFATAHYNLANVLRETGRVDEAVRRYRDALAADPLYEDALFNLVATLDVAGRTPEGIADIRTALAAGLESGEIENLLGILLAQQGDIRGARDSFARALELQPNLPGARENLERAEAMLGGR